jgi:hypothetical protein
MLVLGGLVLSMLSIAMTPTTEVAKIADAHPSKLVVVALDRKASVSHRYTAPESWLKATDQAGLSDQAQPGEFYVFQLGLVSSVKVDSLKLTGLSLKNTAGKTLKATCLNLAGINPDGTPFTRNLGLEKARVQMLWIGVDISGDSKGVYKGAIQVKGAGRRSGIVNVNLSVAGKTLTDHGDSDAWRLSRLRWLNSKVGQGHTITKGYIPLQYKGTTVRNLTHEIQLEPNGWVKQANSFLDEGGRTAQTATPLFTDGLRFTLKTPKADLPIRWEKTKWVSKRDDEAQWETFGRADGIEVRLTGKWEFDGFLSYDIALRSAQDVDLSDVRFEAQMAPQSAKYIAGIGVEGQTLTQPVHWKWDVEKRQDTVWIGGVNNGCSWQFKGSNYRLPLCNIYYKYGKLANPDSWNNQGQGGIVIEPDTKGAKLEAFSGPCKLEAKRTLRFVVEMRLTPVKPIDTDEHWTTRYLHKGDVEDVVEGVTPGGYNTFNLHHAGELNPFINYPYSDQAFPKLTEFIRRAHEKGLRFKIYYTTRELTQNLPEFDALYSLNGEVIFPGPGENVRTIIHPNGPDPWLKGHFDEDYIPAWVQHLDGGRMDLAVVTNPDSRWNNFYLEGLDWLARKAQIDGLYIDDSALDRQSLLRARRILEATRPSPMIDLHSCLHYNELFGFACNVLMYVNLFPYMDRIWFGEGFDPNRAPDYWLVEMSGLPFGEMGEMLNEGGNPWRGMLFGMTQRLPWSGDPRPLWAFWDRFGMRGTRMLGWWDSRVPVHTGRKDVLATVYQGQGKAVIAVASWSSKPEKVQLTIDWAKLGLDEGKAEATIHEINGFQNEIGRVDLNNEIEIPSGKGYLIEVRSKEPA